MPLARVDAALASSALAGHPSQPAQCGYRGTNEELLFMMDTREAIVTQLRAKIGELASTNAAGADAAVSQWLGSIRPALDDALADLKDKRSFLVRMHALHCAAAAPPFSAPAATPWCCASCAWDRGGMHA